MRKIIGFLLVLCFLGCQDKIDVPPAVSVVEPTIQLKKAEVYNITSLKLEAALTAAPGEEVLYGFIVSEFSEPSLERGKVISIGTASTAKTFSYTYSPLETGKAYYVRAYAQVREKVFYSEIKSSATTVPLITMVEPTIISTPIGIHVHTNISNLDPTIPVTFRLGEHTLKSMGSFDNANGHYFYLELPANLQAGEYELSMLLHNNTLHAKEKITKLPGKWAKVADLLSNEWVNTVTFVQANWLYVIAYTVEGHKSFYRQSLTTGQRQALTFGLQQALRAPAVVVHGSKAHFISGEEEYSLYKSEGTNAHYVYDLDKDTWTKEADFPGDPRIRAASGIYNNKIYFGLGYANPPEYTIGAFKLKNDLWEYDLQTKTWKRLADFPQDGRFGNASFMVGSQLYIVGGIDRKRSNKETWCYDSNTNQWTRKADYPGQGYTGLSGFAIGAYGYAGLGERGIWDAHLRDLHQDFYSYHPLTDTWRRVSDFTGNPSLNPHTASNGSVGLLTGRSDLYTSTKLVSYAYTP